MLVCCVKWKQTSRPLRSGVVKAGLQRSCHHENTIRIIRLYMWDSVITLAADGIASNGLLSAPIWLSIKSGLFCQSCQGYCIFRIRFRRSDNIIYRQNYANTIIMIQWWKSTILILSGHVAMMLCYVYILYTFDLTYTYIVSCLQQFR